MTRPLVRIAPPRLLVGDTGALMNEVIQGARNGRLTSLVVALHSDSVRLFVPRNVLEEVTRDLPAYAADRRVDADEAMSRWKRYYLPLVRVVDVPETWGRSNPHVEAVVRRHERDAPAARLTGALAPCFVLAEDPDLTDYGFGTRNWLPMVHAFANHAEMETMANMVYLPSRLTSILVAELWKTIVRWPRWVQLGVLLLVGVGVYWWQRDGRAGKHVGTAKRILTDLWELFGPLLAELFARYSQVELVQRAYEVQPARDTTLQERIARILALSSSGDLLAGDVAREVEWVGSTRSKATDVRSALQTCSAFVEVSRGRWELGSPTGTPAAALPMAELAEWWQRAHVETLPAKMRQIRPTP